MTDQSAQLKTDLTDVANNKLKLVVLVEPITRGETKIPEIALRKPGAGELRGISLLQLQRLDVASILTLLPRITIPPITDHEANAISLEDLNQCAAEIQDFFLTPQQREMAAEMLKNLSLT